MRKEVMILGCILLILLFVFFILEKKVEVEYDDNDYSGAVAPNVFYYEEFSGEALSIDGEDSQITGTSSIDSGIDLKDPQISEISSVVYDEDYPKYGIIEEDFGDDNSFEYAEEDEELLESEKILLEALTSFGKDDTELNDSI